jgi:hypothetical protein
MSERSASELFDKFVTVIDKAASAKRIYDVPEAAEKLGMSGGETHRGMGQRWEYCFTDAGGETVVVSCRWWDQSKAFSIQPDMHVMQVQLTGTVPVRSHERRYEE